MPHVTMSEEEFYAKFKPVRNPAVEEELWGGGFRESFGPDLDAVKDALQVNPACVWTILEDDEGICMSIVDGYHHVNRIGYLVTEVPAEPDTTYEVRDPDMVFAEEEVPAPGI